MFKQEGAVEGECMKAERLANPSELCVQVRFYPGGNYRMRDGLLGSGRIPTTGRPF